MNAFFRLVRTWKVPTSTVASAELQAYQRIGPGEHDEDRRESGTESHDRHHHVEEQVDPEGQRALHREREPGAEQANQLHAPTTV